MARDTTYDTLASRVADRPAGWGQPKGQRHAHRYAAGATLSACGRAFYFGDTVPAPRPPMTPCRACQEGPKT